MVRGLLAEGACLAAEQSTGAVAPAWWLRGTGSVASRHVESLQVLEMLCTLHVYNGSVGYIVVCICQN